MRDRAYVSLPVIVGLIIVVLVLSAIVIVFLPIGTGYRVDVQGHAQHVSGQGDDATFTISQDTYTVARDRNLLSTEDQPGLWFFESNDLVVELTIAGQTFTKNIGKSDTLFAGPVDFTITARHIEPGVHHPTLKLYYMTDTFFGFGGNENYMDSVTFEVVITGDEV